MSLITLLLLTDAAQAGRIITIVRNDTNNVVNTVSVDYYIPPRQGGVTVTTTSEVESLTLAQKKGEESLDLELATYRAQLSTPRDGDTDALASVLETIEDADGTGEATAILSLTDATGEEIARFQGTLSLAEGLVLERVATGDGGDSGDCGARGGCEEGGGRDPVARRDVDLRSDFFFEDIFTRGAIHIEVDGLDLVGLAGASLTLMTTSWGEETCLRYSSETGECLRWGSEEIVTITEVDLGEDLELRKEWSTATGYSKPFYDWHEAGFDQAHGRLSSGRSFREKLALPSLWVDGGSGINALVADLDPYTALSFVQREEDAGDFGQPGGLFTIVSTDWNPKNAPEQAIVNLDGGESWTIPAHSFQRTFQGALDADFDPLDEFEVWIDGEPLDLVGSFETRGVCSWNRCAALSQDEDGAWYLSVTALASTAADLPDSLYVDLFVPSDTADEGSTDTRGFGQGKYGLELDNVSNVDVVFAIPTSFATSPFGMGVEGKLRLEGPADKKGKRKTLLRDSFGGVFTVDGDGEIVLAPTGSRTEIRKGDILIGGEPIGIERTTSTDGGAAQPPEIVIYESNGKGTRNTATATTASPQLL